MKYKIRQSGKTQKAIEFRISREIVSDELDKIYQEISRTASLPGFRVGKAPIELVRKRYKKEATDEAVRKLLAGTFKKAIKESDLEMLGLPEISELQFDEEKGMSYKAVVNIRPRIELKEYKGLKLKKITKKIEERDIDSEIDIIREMFAKFVTKEGGAAKGDYIVCDIDCSAEGHHVEKKENVWLYVGEDAFIPGKSLEGLKINDEKDIDRDLPKDYSRKELSGKKGRFHVKVKELKQKILPEINDKFAAMAGNFKNTAELREAVRESIKKKNELEEKRELENQALKLLDGRAVFDVPQFMIDRHLEALFNRATERLKKERFAEEEIKSMEKNLKERLGEEAVREVRAYFVLDEIARLENIEVDDKGMENAFGIIASSSGRAADEVRGYYEKNGLVEDLREEIRQRKALDFIINNADITEG